VPRLGNDAQLGSGDLLVHAPGNGWRGQGILLSHFPESSSI
jgi:hypothetical protein